MRIATKHSVTDGVTAFRHNSLATQNARARDAMATQILRAVFSVSARRAGLLSRAIDPAHRRVLDALAHRLTIRYLGRSTAKCVQHILVVSPCLSTTVHRAGIFPVPATPKNVRLCS